MFIQLVIVVGSNFLDNDTFINQQIYLNIFKFLIYKIQLHIRNLWRNKIVYVKKATVLYSILFSLSNPDLDKT